MKLFFRHLIIVLSMTLGLASPLASAAAGKVHPEIVFDHKYNKKYNCTVRMEALKLLAPLMGDEFKAELTEYYIALSKAIEEARASAGGQSGEITVSAKGIVSVLTVKEDGLMDVRIDLPKAYLTLRDVTSRDIRKVFEKYLL